MREICIKAEQCLVHSSVLHNAGYYSRMRKERPILLLRSSGVLFQCSDLSANVRESSDLTDRFCPFESTETL